LRPCGCSALIKMQHNAIALAATGWAEADGRAVDIQAFCGQCVPAPFQTKYAAAENRIAPPPLPGGLQAGNLGGGRLHKLPEVMSWQLLNDGFE